MLQRNQVDLTKQIVQTDMELINHRQLQMSNTRITLPSMITNGKNANLGDDALN